MKVRTAFAVAVLFGLAACHRAAVSDQPDADADQRAKTAAKTLADIAAADAAARAPLPRDMPRPAVRHAEPEDTDADVPETVNTTD